MSYHRFESNSKSLLLVGTLVLALFATKNQQVHAAGDEYSVRGHDLVLTIDSRWAGTANGGYYPVRIRVTNRGESRNLKFRFRSLDNDLPSVERTIGVPQNSTDQVTLAIPMVTDATYGTLFVSNNGRRLEGLERQISLPDTNYSNLSRPALLVISSKNLDCNQFEKAVTSIISAGSGSSYSGGHYSGATEDHQVVPPSLLPKSWIGYSGIDIVAMSLETLEKLSEDYRFAILDWIHQGGNLLIFDDNPSAGQSQSLDRLLGLNAHRDVGAEWTPADPSKRRAIRILSTNEYGQIEVEADAKEEAVVGDQKTQMFAWEGDPETFRRRNLMLGQVTFFRENPFPGSPHDWSWYLKSVGPNRYLWTSRHGISARRDTGEFLEFLIPGIEGVPVYAFLFLITVFTVAIGPVNYFFLLRRRQLYLLVVTIPVLAFVTSVSLFGYSAIAHGFGIKSRIRSLTVLDQGTQTAVTKSRAAIYAGLSPSEGLQFKPETAVYPIWPQNEGFESGAVDWTESQALTSGWLRSRTRTQFALSTHRTERGRIDVQAANSEKLPISNGLEWDLESLIVVDNTGQLYVGTHIPAGSTAQLIAADKDKLKSIQKQMGRHPIRVPEGMNNTGSFDMFDGGYGNRYRYGYGYYEENNATYSRSQSEQKIRAIQKNIATSTISVTSPLRKNSYMAILKENPNIDIGVTNTDERAGLHILVGYY